MGRCFNAATLGVLASLSVTAQIEITPSRWSGKVLLIPTDVAVLEMPDTRQDLPCTVLPAEPLLGFDLRFHTGYRIRIPLRELAGVGKQLRTVVRVTPVDRPDNPFFLSDRFSVPPIAENAQGETVLQGHFAVGEGRYRVNWLMRDTSERVCSAHWEFTAVRLAGDRNLELMLPPHTVAVERRDPFHSDPPVERDESRPPLYVKILVHYAPQRPGAVTVEPVEAGALAAILRSIAREPRIGRFSLVAFNVQGRRVLYRQEGGPQIDFPALGESLEGLNLVLVDYRKMQEKNGGGLFLGELLEQALAEAEDTPDALIFVGPKVTPGEGDLPEAWKHRPPVGYPVFYVNYNYDPRVNPWRDAITTAVRSLRGRVYSVSRPRELGAAWRDIMERLTAAVKAAN